MSSQKSISDTAGISADSRSNATSRMFGRNFGPVYSTKSLMAIWQIDDVEVARLVSDDRLLALKVRGEYLFPRFQFEGTMVRDDVTALVKTLRPSADPFNIAQWLHTPILEARGRTVIEILDSGDTVMAERLAMKASRLWSS